MSGTAPGVVVPEMYAKPKDFIQSWSQLVRGEAALPPTAKNMGKIELMALLRECGLLRRYKRPNDFGYGVANGEKPRLFDERFKDRYKDRIDDYMKSLCRFKIPTDFMLNVHCAYGLEFRLRFMKPRGYNPCVSLFNNNAGFFSESLKRFPDGIPQFMSWWLLSLFFGSRYDRGYGTESRCARARWHEHCGTPLGAEQATQLKKPIRRLLENIST